MHHRGLSKVRLDILESHNANSHQDILSNSDDKSLLAKAEFSQPLCTALQIGLVDLLASWNIYPSAVIGHSSGELAAAYAAGALTATHALVAAFYRGHVCKTAKRKGGMAAIGLGAEDVSNFLSPGVRVACENSGSSVTLSGDLDVLESVMSKIKEQRPDVLVRKLQVEMAYHSRKFLLRALLFSVLTKGQITWLLLAIFTASLSRSTCHHADQRFHSTQVSNQRSCIQPPISVPSIGSKIWKAQFCFIRQQEHFLQARRNVLCIWKLDLTRLSAAPSGRSIRRHPRTSVTYLLLFAGKMIPSPS